MGPPQPPSSSAHDADPAQAFLGPRGLIDRTEYVRVLEQALRALGYEGVAQALEAASGVQQQPEQGSAFRAAVLRGDYDAALRLLPSVAADPSSVATSRFLLLQQKFLEGVRRGETAAALRVLRTELQPLQGVQQGVLHSLAALLLAPPGAAPAQLPAAGGGASAEELAEGRAALLDALQGDLLPSLLIPERRLEELVEQALLSQLDRCPYHNSWGARLSLLADYTAGPDQLPTQPGQVLEGHTSEVWSVAFSPDGRWAASASKDGSALLWEVTGDGRLEAPRPLLRQGVPCQLVAFSPSSQLLLVASLDSLVRLYDVPSGKLLRRYSMAEDDSGGHSGAAGRAGAEQVVGVSWLPDSRRFVAATHRGLALVDAGREGPAAVLRRLQPPHAFLYDAVVAGGDCVITVGQDKKIGFCRLSDGRTEVVGESGTVTSLGLSRCGRWLTANLSDSCIHLWSLRDLAAAGAHPPSPLGPPADALNGAGAGGAGATNGAAAAAAAELQWSPRQHGGGGDPFDSLPAAPVHEFRMADARPSRFVLRSCVGGARAGFVACGAEDCRLYIWSRLSGELLASLPGHSGCINAVAWHPKLPWLLASASDDGTLRTWVAPAAQRQQ